MAGNDGMADPASVMGSAMPFGQAVVSTVAPPATQPGQPAANPWKASWRTVNGVGDYYYEKDPGNWQAIPDYVRNSNQGQFGLPAVQGRRAAEQGAKQEAKLDAISAKQDQIRRDENAYRDRRDAITDQRYIDSREDANNLRRDQITLSRDQMDLTRSENAATREQQSAHFLAGIDQQNKLLEANDKTNNRRLDIEDRHFQQKLAYDNKMSRRAQIISSLSLVAQSLSRL